MSIDRQRSLRKLRQGLKFLWLIVLYCAVTGSPVLWFALATAVPPTWDAHQKGRLS